MSVGYLQLPSVLAAIALGCLLAVTLAPPPPTPDDGYHFGFRHGAVTGYALTCLTAAVALWVFPHLHRLRRPARGLADPGLDIESRMPIAGPMAELRPVHQVRAQNVLPP